MEATAPTFTPEQQQTIKASLVNQLNLHFVQYIESIKRIPGVAIELNEALKFYQTGYYWQRGAIENMSISAPIPTIETVSTNPAPDVNISSQEQVAA